MKMGQSSSSQHSGNGDTLRSRQNINSTNLRGTPVSQSGRIEPRHGRLSSHPTTPLEVVDSSRPVTTFSRQVSSRSITQARASQTQASSQPDEDMFFEGHISNISASPMPRRSRLSRFSSNLTSWQARDNDQDGINDRARRRLGMPPSLNPVNLMRGPLRSRGRTQTNRSLSPSPQVEDGTNLYHTSYAYIRDPSQSENHDSSLFLGTLVRRLVRLRGSRLTRSNLGDRTRRQVLNAEHPAPENGLLYDRSSSVYSTELPPTHSAHDPDNTNDDFGIDRIDQGPRTSGLFPHPEGQETLGEEGEGQSRLSSFSLARHSDSRGLRRRTFNMRGSSANSTQQDAESSISQLLSATAMAIATQISHSPRLATDGTEGPRSESIDAVFQPIHQVLQYVVRSHGDRSIENSSGVTPPLNFLRVFNFGSTSLAPISQSSPLPEVSESNESAATQRDRHGGIPHGQRERNVTVVVVAVQPAVSENRLSAFQALADTTASHSIFDPMINLPSFDETWNSTLEGPSSRLRQGGRLSRLAQLRRASHLVSSGNMGWLQGRSHSHRRVQITPSRGGLEDNFGTQSATSPLVSGDSPPGPVPPPSTPAEHNNFATSSQPATLSRRQSVVSSLHYPILNEVESIGEEVSEGDSARYFERELRFPRHRRRSESDSARYRHFGAGAARRNGVVEPDSVGEGDDPVNRDWLIYVVGTNSSGDYPAWTTPGIFSDVCFSAAIFSHALLIFVHLESLI